MSGPGVDPGSTAAPDHISTRRRNLLLVVAVVVVAVLGSIAIGMATRSNDDKGGSSTSDAAAASLPTAPTDWPVLDAEQARSITEYLEGPGSELVEMRAASEPLLGEITESSCQAAIVDLQSIDPQEALAAAVDVPDAPLSQMFINQTGQVSRVVVFCRAADVDADSAAADQEDLATLDSYIGVRLTQVEQAT